MCVTGSKGVNRVSVRSVLAGFRQDPPRAPEGSTVSRRMSQPVAWAMALGILAIAVKGHFLISVDLGMAQGMEAIRMPGLDVAMKAITFFGNPLWVLGVMAVMSLWWLRPSPGTPARLASLAKPNEAAGVGEGSAGAREGDGHRSPTE